MRKILFPLIFSLLMMAGSGMAMADNHHGSRGGHKTEQRDHRNHNNGKKNDKKKHDKKHDNRPGHGSVAPAHRPAQHYRPASPKPNHKHYRPGRALPPRLHDMVAYTTRGCSNVAVWQIDPNTFIVKFRKGGRYYTRMLYPYSYQYGPTQSISVNWQPLSPWTLIPSVNLNISL